MSSIVSTIQEIVRHELRRLRITELGLVDAVYPHSASGDSDNYGCDVKLKNSGLLLKRVPISTGHIGTVAVPNVGDLVMLSFENGDVNQPIVVGRLYNDGDRPPLNNPNEVIFRLPLAQPDDKTVKSYRDDAQDHGSHRGRNRARRGGQERDEIGSARLERRHRHDSGGTHHHHDEPGWRSRD